MTHQEETDRVLTFPDGLPGFPEASSFMLVDIVEDGAFQIMQSLDDEELSMVVCVPWVFFPEYAPEISTIDQMGLGLDKLEDAVIFVPVTLDPEKSQVTLNLLGPFVVNVHSRIGRQVVLADSEYPLKAVVGLA